MMRDCRSRVYGFDSQRGGHTVDLGNRVVAFGVRCAGVYVSAVCLPLGKA